MSPGRFFTWTEGILPVELTTAICNYGYVMTKELDWPRFIDFWKQFYDERTHPDREFYDPYINDLSKDDSLDKLWQWKMGVHFDNRNSQKALRLMKENKETIRTYRETYPSFQELHDFAKRIFQSGVIYSVFLMHICAPERYPIFDQNVFRSFIFLTTGKIGEAPQEIQDYLRYREFVFKIHKHYKADFRDIDQALMAFGQFLAKPELF